MSMVLRTITTSICQWLRRLIYPAASHYLPVVSFFNISFRPERRNQFVLRFKMLLLVFEDMEFCTSKKSRTGGILMSLLLSSPIVDRKHKTCVYDIGSNDQLEGGATITSNIYTSRSIKPLCLADTHNCLNS